MQKPSEKNFFKYLDYIGDKSRKNDRFKGVDWFCDGCGSLLNIQKGFNDHHRVWKCEDCGFKNRISKKAIID